MTEKVKLDKFLTMAQYSWHNFARELSHYDLADSMHMLCPPRKCLANMELGGFLLNITPDTPFEDITQENLYTRWHDQIAEIKRLGKPFDFWGIFEAAKLPTGPGYTVSQCQMPPEEYEYMMREVGYLFIGWELGEWDGLYGRDVVYYWKPEEYPLNRKEAHDRLVGYLRDMKEKLYSNVNCLCGVTFAHYFNELPVRMLGAEVAQGLLNNQVYISFLRGACKQYGLQYKIISSIFDRWGYRCYTDSPDVTMENETGIGVWTAGPHYGHSIGLLQAIWITSYFAEAAIVGLDGGFYTDQLRDGVRELSPLGEAFYDYTKWSRDAHPRGRQLRPVAFMLDYYAGWAPPRHLYSFKERVAWHSLPYGPSDNAMDQAYELFYPGYCKCGYYRDERGFVTVTPMGDSVDVLFSDASVDAMGDYPIIWLLSDELPDADFISRLRSYVDNGGHLIVGGAPMVSVASEWFDVQVSQDKKQAITSVIAETGDELREAYFSVREMTVSAPWTVHALTEAGDPLIISRRMGDGQVTFLAADHGLTDDFTAPGFDMNRNLDFTPDPPFELLHCVQFYIKDIVAQETPVEISGKEIYYCINDLGGGEYVVCLYNPGYETWTGTIALRNGMSEVESIDGPWGGGTLAEDSRLTLKSNETAVLRCRPKGSKRC